MKVAAINPGSSPLSRFTSHAVVTVCQALGRRSSILGRSIDRGKNNLPHIAFTFDDGPSESTPQLLSVLERYGAKATFFQIGSNVQRLPEISCEVVRSGHEVANHTFFHPRLILKSSEFIYTELERTQDTIQSVTSVRPQWFRPPYGVGWFGLRSAQCRLALTGVLWTAIGRDWEWPAARVVEHLSRRACNGAIFCLHDGRCLVHRPDITATIESVQRLLPILCDRGYQFKSVGMMLGKLYKQQQ